MTTDKDKALNIFNEAKQLAKELRESFLLEMCGDDEVLRKEVEEMLKVYSESAQTISDDSDGELDYSAGTMIGHFKVLRKLGEGGFGVVYLVEQQEPVKRRLALKVIKPGMDTKRVIARFEAERQALAIMNHPGICPVYEAGVTDRGLPYIAMEEVKGSPITVACNEQRFSVQQRLELMIDVCNALQHAHMKGVIHRDIKPNNILVYISEDGKLSSKIIDFGVAKATGHQLTDKTFATMEGRMLGTPAYMSPEQANPAATDIDVRSDVYSLGVVLYELLVGKPPFDASTLNEAGYDEMRRIIREVEPPRPTTKLSSLSNDEVLTVIRDRQTEISQLSGLLHKELEWIPLKAMRKLRHERYDSAKALGEDIKRYLSGEPLEAGPQSSAYLVKKYVRRNQVKLMTASVIALVVIAGTLVSIYFDSKASRAREALVEARANNEKVDNFMQGITAGKVKDDFDLPVDLMGLADEQTARDSGAIKHKLEVKTEMMEYVYADQPEVRAKIAEEVGLTFSSIGAYTEAETLLETSISINRELYGENATPTLNAKMSMVELLKEQGRYSQAEELVREVIDARILTDGLEYRQTLEAKWWLGYLLMAQQKFNEAEVYLQEALEGYTKINGGQDDQLPLLIGLHGDFYFQQQNYREAKQRYQESIELSENNLGNTHPVHMHVLKKMGILLTKQGNFKEAETFFRGMLDTNRSKNKNSRETFDSFSILGDLYKEQLDYAKAELMYRRAADGYRRIYKTADPDTLEAIGDLGELYLTEFKFGAAQDEFEDVLAFSRDLGPNHPSAFLALEWMGDLYQKQSKYEEASANYNASVEGHEKFYGAEHPATLNLKSKLARQLELQAKYAEAEILYDHVLEVRTRVFGPEHEKTVDTFLRKANFVQGTEGWVAAEKMYKDAVARYREEFGDSHTQTMRLKAALAEFFEENEQYIDAEQLYREICETKKQELGSEQLETISSRVPLASVLTSLGRSQEAEELLQENLDTTRRVYGEWHPATLGAQYQVVKNLAAQEKFTEAEKMARDGLQKFTKLFGKAHSQTLLVRIDYGTLLRKMYRYDDAEEMMLQYLNATLELFGENHISSVQARWWLAYNLVGESKYLEAKDQYLKTYLAAQQLYGVEHEQTLSIKAMLATCLRYAGDVEEAEAIQKEIVVANNRIRGELHRQSIAALLVLGKNYYMNNGKLDEATEVLELALERSIQSFGENNPETGTAYEYLGNLASDNGEIAKANAYFKRATEIYQQFYGDYHSRSLQVARDYVQSLENVGKVVEAERYARDLVEHAFENINIEDPQRQEVTNWLGKFLQRNGRIDEVETLYLDELAACTEQLSNNHPRTLTELSRLAEFLYEQQNYDEAERYIRKSLDGHRAYYGLMHPRSLQLYSILLGNLMEQNKIAAALYEVDQVADQVITHFGEESTFAMQVTYLRGILLFQLGRLSEAAPEMSKAIELYANLYGPEDARVVGWKHQLAGLYQLMGMKTSHDIEQELKDALSESLEKRNPSHPETLRAKELLADFLEDEGKLPEAEELRRELLAVHAHLGANHKAKVNATRNLASVLRQQNKYEEAEQILRQLVNIAIENLHDEDDSTTLNRKRSLAYQLVRMGRFDEANELLQNVYQAILNKYPETHESVLDEHDTMAWFYERRGAFKQAEEFRRKIIETSINEHGEQHDSTLEAREDLRNLYLAQGRYAEAEKISRSILEIRTQTMGNEGQAKKWDEQGNLVNILLDQGKYADAEEYLQTLIEYYVATYGALHDDTLGAKVKLARMLKLQGKYAEAIDVFQPVLNAYQDAHSNWYRVQFLAMRTLAYLHMEQGNEDEAVALAEETLGLCKRVGEDYLETLYAMFVLAEINIAFNRFDEAEVLLSELLARSKRLYGNQDTFVLVVMGKMSELFLAMDRHSESEQILGEALSTSDRVYGRGHPSTVELIGLMGELQRAQANYDEAETLLLECFNVNATTRSMEHEKTRDAIEEVVLLYDAMGNAKEAQKYRAMLPKQAPSPELEEVVVGSED